MVAGWFGFLCRAAVASAAGALVVYVLTLCGANLTDQLADVRHIAYGTDAARLRKRARHRGQHPRAVATPWTPGRNNFLKWTRATPAFIIVCGHGEMFDARELPTLLRSMFLLTSSPLKVHILTDSAGRAEIGMFLSRFNSTRVHVCIDIVVVDEARILDMAAHVDYDASNSHHSGIWGTAKLFVPWLLPEIQDAIVIDTDMIFVQDPSKLMDEFRNGGSRWIYRLPLDFKSRRNPANGVCSCVFLVRMEAAREQHVYPKLFKEAIRTPGGACEASGKAYRCQYGDQGVMSNLWQPEANQHLLSQLPQIWNADRCHNYYGLLRGDREAGILHRNCGSENARESEAIATVYFDFFERYQPNWLSGPGRIHVHYDDEGACLD